MRTPVPAPFTGRDHRADGAKGGRARGGRPPKLDDARFKMILDNLQLGLTRNQACNLAGVHVGSLTYLMNASQTAKAAVLTAEAKIERHAIAVILNAKDPRWAAWWLAHNPRTREQWGEKPSRSTTFVGGQQTVEVNLPSFDSIVKRITRQRQVALEAERKIINITPPLPTPQEHVEALIERRADGPLPDR
jgi:hypothetical protein